MRSRHFYFLSILLCISFGTSAQGDARQNSLFARISHMPNEAFIKNITDHKVHSIERTSNPGFQGDDAYLEFDKAGRLTLFRQGHDANTFWYDEQGRLAKEYSTHMYGQFLGSSAFIYDDRHKDVVVARQVLDSAGNLEFTGSTTTIETVNDTTVYTTKGPQDARINNRNNTASVRREIKVKDTLFVFTYSTNVDYSSGDEDRLQYSIYTGNVLRQDGEVATINGFNDKVCLAPVNAPFVNQFIAGKQARIASYIRKQIAELPKEYQKELLGKLDKPMENEWLVAANCYVYDEQGRILDKLVRGGYIVHYTYNAQGHLTSISQNNRIPPIIFNYDEKGMLTGWSDAHTNAKYEYTFY